MLMRRFRMKVFGVKPEVMMCAWMARARVLVAEVWVSWVK